MNIRSKKHFLFLLTLIFTFTLFAGCYNTSPDDSQKTVVAVSIVPEKEFVRAVAGDLADIVTMIPPGSSPETYQPTPQDMQAFSEAKIYFVMGVPAEEAGIIKKAKELNPDIKIVRLDEEVAKIYPNRYFKDGHSHSDEVNSDSDHGSKDPHIWMSPKRVMVMIDVIERELSAIDEENSSLYSENAKNYVKILEDLDSAIKSTLAGLQNRSFIIYHPSLGYFADDYGLDMVSVEIGGKSATARDLQSIVDFAKSKNIRVVFYQAEIDNAQSKTLADEIGGRVVEVEPLSGNYIENMKKIAATFEEVLK